MTSMIALQNYVSAPKRVPTSINSARVLVLSHLRSLQMNGDIPVFIELTFITTDSENKTKKKKRRRFKFNAPGQHVNTYFH